MKKLFIFTIITLLSVTIAQSQEFRLGAKAGLNVASLGGDTFYGGLNTRVSFHIGGLVEIPLVGKFSLQPEILYSSQGSSFDYYNGTFVSFNGDVKLDYINVPVLAKFYIIEGLSAEAGPVFSVLVSAEEDEYNASEEATVRVDSKDNYKGFDAAFAIGASYRLNMGVFFSLRYNKGLLDVNDIDGYNGKNQNNVFQVSAGYSF
ncbi:porin family protein [Aequorivita lipolytica]|uniref:porin family protein n=1 Tax=Aequorivita lipolytica TaxID=153267 RepID=UPI000DBC0707|nr:porin family protein [Aequorivita lipolytica]SRX51482.1 hypothetical protein AEQU2_01965 [Aequorivita lipolytica]